MPFLRCILRDVPQWRQARRRSSEAPQPAPRRIQSIRHCRRHRRPACPRSVHNRLPPAQTVHCPSNRKDHLHRRQRGSSPECPNPRRYCR